MSCNICGSSFGTYVGSINCPSVPIPNLGIPCGSGCGTGPSSDTSCIIYSGPQLNCTGILSGDSLTNILAKIDAQVCSTIGDFTTFNTHCLGTISTLPEFVDKITDLACTTDANLNTFIGTTFPDYQISVSAQLSAITNPGLTLCASSGVVMGDSLNTILTKLANKICNIQDTQLSLSGVNWSQCFVVSPTPTTVAQGFSAVINQICQLNTLVQSSGSGTLPTFNTTGTCLPSPAPNDSLVSTVNKLVVRTCQSPTFDINALSWNCITQPTLATTDIQSAFQSVLTKIDSISQNFPTFSGDFTIANVNPSFPCLGKTISLATPSSQDRFVAVDGADTTPGTLVQKLTAGTNVTFDTTTVPGTMILNSTGGGSGNNKVAVSSADASPDYLFAKVEAGNTAYGVTVTPALDSANNTVAFNISIDPLALFNALLDTLVAGQPITTKFCNLVASCPSPCAAPSNVTVTYSSGGTTTTTTTTTT